MCLFKSLKYSFEMHPIYELAKTSKKKDSGYFWKSWLTTHGEKLEFQGCKIKKKLNWWDQVGLKASNIYHSMHALTQVQLPCLHIEQSNQQMLSLELICIYWFGPSTTFQLLVSWKRRRTDILKSCSWRLRRKNECEKREFFSWIEKKTSGTLSTEKLFYTFCVE